MGTTLAEFSSYLTKCMQPELFQDIFLNGILVEGSPTIHSFAVAVSASSVAIEKAALFDVDLLLTHHGILFKNRSDPILGSLRKKIGTLIENNITLMTYHLPLDAHHEYGNCFPVGRLLGATSLQPFVYQKEEIGVIAAIPPILRSALKDTLEGIYDHKASVAFGGSEEIKSLAIISGHGHKFLKNATQIPVDAFITGSFDEPSWNEAFEEKINFFACGHSATEIIGVRLLAEHLSQKFHIPHYILKDDNPF